MIDDYNEDWPKSTWDFYCGGTLITDMPGLLWALQLEGLPTAEQHAALVHFDTLPASQAMPDELRAEFDAVIHEAPDDDEDD
jgi:hypothetical protein